MAYGKLVPKNFRIFVANEEKIKKENHIARRNDDFRHIAHRRWLIL